VVEQSYSINGFIVMSLQRCVKMAKMVKKKRLSFDIVIYIYVFVTRQFNWKWGSKNPLPDVISTWNFFAVGYWVQQWYTSFAKFQDPSLILTWFSSVLKLGIFGNRDKYVLLCWQNWILEVKVPFSGWAISFISLLLVTNSKIHDIVTWKRSIIPN
jgi:hypothetical protein